MASGGTAAFSPTASMSPLRTTTVPLAMTGPLTVTIFALRMAMTAGASAHANTANRNKAAASFFIEVNDALYSVVGEACARGSGLPWYRLHEGLSGHFLLPACHLRGFRSSSARRRVYFEGRHGTHHLRAGDRKRFGAGAQRQDRRGG